MYKELKYKRAISKKGVLDYQIPCPMDKAIRIGSYSCCDCINFEGDFPNHQIIRCSYEEKRVPPTHKKIMSKQWYDDTDLKFIKVISYCEHCEIYSMDNGLGATSDWFIGRSSEDISSDRT